MAQHIITGEKGEGYAVAYLKSKGHEILACNYRYDKAEIDIISKHSGLIVFTEVKTRSTAKFGFPEEFVTPKKQQLISKAASHYMEENKLKGEVRFDIVSLVKTETGYDVHWIQDAFFVQG